MKAKILVVSTLALIALVSAAFLYGVRSVGVQEDYVNISVISRHQNPEHMESIRLGIQQAAADKKAEVTFISLAQDNNAQEQIELLQREVINGADAILLIAADSEALKVPVELTAQKVPVVALETPVDAKNRTSCITANHKAMGEALGKSIENRTYRQGTVMILQNAQGCDNIKELQDGLFKGFAGTALTPVLVPMTEVMEKNKGDMERAIKQYTPVAIVALDGAMLESCAVYLQNSEKWEGKLYGVGMSGKIASFIERGLIEAAVVQNNFNIGYLGLQDAVEAIHGRKVKNTAEIEFRIIHADNMYDIENQRLLFPFVR